MSTRILRVHDVLKDRILVGRESARLLENPLRALMASAQPPGMPSHPTPVTVDFEGVEGMAPSFLDELVSVFESLIGTESNGRERCLIIANPPTRLSSKFEAVARGHGMSARLNPDGSWVLRDTRPSDA
jgi:hypothetical protein